MPSWWGGVGWGRGGTSTCKHLFSTWSASSERGPAALLLPPLSLSFCKGGGWAAALVAQPGTFSVHGSGHMSVEHPPSLPELKTAHRPDACPALPCRGWCIIGKKDTCPTCWEKVRTAWGRWRHGGYIWQAAAAVMHCPCWAAWERGRVSAERATASSAQLPAPICCHLCHRCPPAGRP